MFHFVAKKQTDGSKSLDCHRTFFRRVLYRMATPAISAVVALFAQMLHTTSVEAQTADRPNIIYIMADDMGYSDIGCYGSEIETPNLDALAEEGIRFTQFYNTARCCPTRASLLTGLYPHQAGIGHMMEDRGFEGYRGDLNRHCVTIPEALKSAGYRSYMSGKWHVTKSIAPSSFAEKQNWPLQRGFDQFYGTIHGAGSFFDPNTLTRGNDFISPFADPEYTPADREDETYYYTNAIADHAAGYVREHSSQSNPEPFFLYVSFTAAHWPMHALDKDIEKYKGKYDAGYAAVRNARYQRMIELGVIDKESTVNWAIPDDWMNEEEWEWDKRNMEVYAAMIDSMDRGIGRIVAALKETDQLDNTMICFFQDNGGCAENYGRGGQGGPRAKTPSLPPIPDHLIQPHMTPTQSRDGFPMRTGVGSLAGPADTAIGYGKAWATVSNTPFREYKHWVHEGGISTPLIVHWPSKINRPGSLENTPSHLVDLMATAIDVAEGTYPETFHNQNTIKPLQGKSLVPLFTGGSIERDAIFWEHEGNRAVRKGDFKLVAKGTKGEWELYNIAQDRSEQNNLSDQNPQLVKELADLWQQYAERSDVLPLSPPRPGGHSQPMNRKQMRFQLKGKETLPTSSAPFIQNRNLRVKAVADIQGDGSIIAQGGSSHGWGIYVQNGEVFLVVTRSGKRNILASGITPKGKTTIEAELPRQGPLRLRINGQNVPTTMRPGSLSEQPQDGLQVGQDTGGAVGNYKTPFPFSGTIDSVQIDLK